MIYADFGRSVPEVNEKQNPDESYTKKYQNHVTCSCNYRLLCVDDKLSKLFKSYLGADAGYNFINCMLKENDIVVM